MEVAQNLHWLNLGMVNAFLSIDGDGLTLIDAGQPRKADDILGYVQKIGRSASDVKRILITHADMDHVGSLAAVQQATGAAVYASAASAELISQGKSPQHNFWLMDTVGSLFLNYDSIEKRKINIVQEGDTLPVLGGLNVYSTPGHTLDHLSFFSPSTHIAFIGDALAARRAKLSLSSNFISADSDKVRQSAQKLFALDIGLYACGHGPPLNADDPSVLTLKNELD